MDLKQIQNPLGADNQSYAKAGDVTLRKTIENGALGAGHAISTYGESLLPKYITPTALKAVAGTPRVFGGLITLATAGPRIYRSYQEDKIKGDFNNTRKEVFVTASSATGTFAAGTLAGAATAGATILGAPAIVVGGIAVAGLFAAGYAGYKAGEWASEFYDSIR